MPPTAGSQVRFVLANRSEKYARIEQKFPRRPSKGKRKGSRTYVIWPPSVKFFGTRGLVKVRGTIDGQPFRGSFMAMGNGKQMLPVKADLRKAIGKEVGQSVTVHLTEQLK